MSTSATRSKPVKRPKLAVIVANGITGDSRVQKTALAAARAGWDVTLIGRSTGKKREHAWFGPVKVIRVPVANHYSRRVAAKGKQASTRSLVTQWGVSDNKALEQLRAEHKAWVREQSARIGWSSGSPVAGVPAAGRKAWIRARRSAHRIRVRAYRWEEGHKARNKAKNAEANGDWRHDWPGLVDLDLAFGPVIEELEPDVIHANDITMINTGALAAARLRARGLKCAWLYDAHEYVAGVEWRLPAMDSAFPAVEREFIGKADAVVTVSPEIAEIIQADHKLATTPLVVRNTPIRGVVGENTGRVSVRAACELGDDVPLLVYSGWIASERGLGTAVEGLAQLPDHHLAIVAGFKSDAASPTGVGDHARRGQHRGDQTRVRQRAADVQIALLQLDAVLLGAGHQTGVGEQRHRHRQRGQRGEDGGEPLRVVGVVRPVQRGEQERSGRIDALGQCRCGVLPGLHRVADAQADVDHHVTRQPGPVGQALVGEVAHGLLGGGQQQIGAVVGEDPVVLLRHPAVEGPQAGFEMGHRQVHLHRGQRAGDGGVGVPVDQDPVRPLVLQHLVHRGEHRSGLHPVAPRAHAQVHIGGGDAESVEEHVGQIGVVVLTGVHDDVLMRGAGESRGDGRELHELGAGADDAEDLHVVLLPGGCLARCGPAPMVRGPLRSTVTAALHKPGMLARCGMSAAGRRP
ncbi:hypothetical protein SMICM304S_08124 [Streptomyces microflavus]